MRLALLLVSFGFVWHSNNQAFSQARVYAPHQYSRPSPESVFVEGPVESFVRFWWNHADDGVHVLEHFLELLEPESIQAQEGFRDFKTTRVSFYSYEIRSREVLDRIAELLALGVHIRIVTDGKNHAALEMPTDEVWESWTEAQQLYFIFAYGDEDKSKARVSESDIQRTNTERFLAIESLKRLRSLKRKYRSQVEITLSPNEVVPQNDHFNYPRNHHFKGASLEFKSKSSKSSWGPPVWLWTGSANFTDTCMDRKVEPSLENKRRYLSGEAFRFDPKSEGHIQFGAVFEGLGAEAMQALMGPIEKWNRAYRNGKHYDSVPLPESLYPRVVFEDGSSLQAFFSEGQRLDGQRGIDPVKVVERILSRQDIELQAYYDTQFVFTHHGHAKHLRSVLNLHRPEKFFVAVDSSQALEDYSAVPSLLFAPGLNDVPGTFPGRAFDNAPSLAEELSWAENVRVYRGGIDLHRRENDKLHSKAKYFRYKDARGVQTCVLYFGSGNATYNVSRLSADAMYLLETQNPQVCQQLENYFESLRDHHRMEAFDAAYLERKIKQHFYLTKDLQSAGFYRRFADFIHRRGQKRSFDSLISVLEKAGAVTPEGEMILKWLKWQQKHRERLTEFSWVDIFLVFRLANQERAVSEELAHEIFEHWRPEGARAKSAKAAFTRLIQQGVSSGSSSSTVLTGNYLQDAKQRVLQDCRDFMSAVRSGRHERQRHRVAPEKKRRQAS